MNDLVAIRQNDVISLNTFRLPTLIIIHILVYQQLQAGLLPISYVGAPQCAPFGELFWTAVCASATAPQAVVSVYSTSDCQGTPLDTASLLADGETCTTKRYPTFMATPANFVATCSSPYEWPVSFSGHVGSMSQVLSRSYFAP